MYARPYARPPAALPPASRVNRSNWGLRLVAMLLSALAFLGFWQGAQHNAPAASGNDYAPPSGSQGGLLPAGGLSPHGSTHLS